MGTGTVADVRLPAANPGANPPPALEAPTAARAAASPGGYRLEPAWHPQLAALTAAPAPNAAPDPYALPDGVAVGDVVSGTAAQPFDVTMSQLATAVYATRGGPPAGWSAVSDDQLRERGIADPAAWRNQFLGSPGNQWEFKAEIYTDGKDNFVLAYRGTEGSLDDWTNNFKQGAGFSTDPVDKYSGVAMNTAVEFKRVFAARAPDGTPKEDPNNLAIAGHSQGGALAAIGALATGIPATNFDAAGVHPATLARIGIDDPQQARDIAESGLIRTYSLKSDLLTQLQEGSVLAPLLPDALGTSIVVEPEPGDRNTVFGRGAGIEFPDLSEQELARLNALVEAARNSGIPLIDLAGDLAYGAMSHNPNLLTAAMIQREPWQPGYRNPFDAGKAVQDLIPDELKDDYSRNVHETGEDIVTVVKTDFASGQWLQGGMRITGDVAEGIFNSVGDTFNRGADALADSVDARIDGPAGDIAAGLLRGGGKTMEFVADGIGNGVELVSDGVGFLAQKTSNWIGSLFH